MPIKAPQEREHQQLHGILSICTVWPGMESQIIYVSMRMAAYVPSEHFIRGQMNTRKAVSFT